MRFSLAMAFAAVSCATPADPGPCNAVCDVLFDQCQLESFASYSECEGSCAHADENGADVSGYAACLTDVNDCNTYDIVECENEFGW